VIRGDDELEDSDGALVVLKIVGVMIVFAGAIANAAPCASGVDPVHAYLYPDDDNYAGSGREVAAKPISLSERRQTAAYLLEKAAQCRRLAAEIIGDPTSDALIKLAEEFEAQAAAFKTARTPGGGSKVEPPSGADERKRLWLRLRPYARLTKYRNEE
jgi:hypothetical protein